MVDSPRRPWHQPIDKVPVGRARVSVRGWGVAIVLVIVGFSTAVADQSARLPCIYTQGDGSVMITDDLSDPRCAHLRPSREPAADYPLKMTLEVAEMIGLAHWMAIQYRVDHRLVEALIEVESRYDPAAVSPKGAMGLMQIMSPVARQYGIENPFDVWQNLEAGIRYLRQLLMSYGADLERVLAAYNAGPAAVEKYSGIPPYPETQNYVRRVLRRYRQRVAEAEEH